MNSFGHRLLQVMTESTRVSGADEPAAREVAGGPAATRSEARLPRLTSVSRSDREIVFVDTAAPDLEALVEVLGRTCDVVVLQAADDGVAAILDALTARPSVDTVHLLAHGDSGDYRLGRTAMHDQAVADLGRQLHAEGLGLGATGGLVLYRLFRPS